MINLTTINRLIFVSLCCAVFTSAVLACAPTAKPAYRQLYMVYKDGKTGYIDAAGKLVVKAAYNRGTNFREGFAIVSSNDDKKFFINEAGRKLAAPAFEEAWLFSDGVAGVKIGDKWGFINRTGRLVIPAKFDAADSFCGGRAVAALKKDGKLKFGFIDKTGKFAVQPKFNYITAFSDGVAQYSEDAKYIQKSSYFLVDTGAHYGLINSSGKILAEPKFDKIHLFFEGYAEAVAGDKTGFIDKSGRWLEGFDGEVTRWFSEGLAAAYKAPDGYGYINKQGKFVIEPQFIDGKEFSGELAPVKTQKGWGFIDKTGKIVIAEKFSDAEPFVGPLARVIVNSGKVDPKDKFPELLFGYIDKSGKYAWKPSR